MSPPAAPTPFATSTPAPPTRHSPPPPPLYHYHPGFNERKKNNSLRNHGSKPQLGNTEALVYIFNSSSLNHDFSVVGWYRDKGRVTAYLKETKASNVEATFITERGAKQAGPGSKPIARMPPSGVCIVRGNVGAGWRRSAGRWERAVRHR